MPEPGAVRLSVHKGKEGHTLTATTVVGSGFFSIHVESCVFRTEAEAQEAEAHVLAALNAARRELWIRAGNDLADFQTSITDAPTDDMAVRCPKCEAAVAVGDWSDEKGCCKACAEGRTPVAAEEAEGGAEGEAARQEPLF